MKKLPLLIAALSMAMVAATGAQTFTGVITDTMCGANHEMMQVTPYSKCVRECVRTDPAKYRYAVYDGKNVYTLSDQKASEAYAGQKVRITGMLDEGNKTIEVDKIERAD